MTKIKFDGQSHLTTINKESKHKQVFDLSLLFEYSMIFSVRYIISKLILQINLTHNFYEIHFPTETA